MRKPYLFFLLFFQLVNGFGQLFSNVSWSEPIEPGAAQQLQGLYGNHQFSFMVFTDRNRSFTGLTLAGIDQNGHIKKVAHTLSSPAYAFAGAYVKNEQMVVLLEYQREENGQFIQEVKSLSFSHTALTAETVLLTHTTRSKSHLGKIRFAISPDRKTSLLFAESPYRAGNNEEIKLWIMDAGGREQTYTFSLGIESKQNVHNYPQVANSGVVYFLKRDKDKSQQFRYFLYSFIPSASDLSQKAIVLGNTGISDIRGTVTPQGEFLVGGFTSSEGVHNYEGYFLMKFDQACMQKFRTQGQFDESTALRFVSKKEYGKLRAIGNYYIENITVTPTGRIYITAEGYSESPGKKDVYYNYEDIMLVCFNEGGDYRATFKVEKNQGVRGEYTSWASFRLYCQGDTLMTLHNNMGKVEGEKGPEPLLYSTKVHEKWGLTPVSAISTLKPSETGTFFHPGVFVQEDNRHLTAVFSDPGHKTYTIARVQL